MGQQRDIFANFELMRREIDQLFGDVWRRAGYIPHGHPNFSPKVDVYLCGDPAKIVAVVELAGVEVEEVSLEVQGRDLFIRGRRKTAAPEGRDYQQIEIENGEFERRVELACDVDPDGSKATYIDGMLKIELPVVDQRSQSSSTSITEEEHGT